MVPKASEGRLVASVGPPARAEKLPCEAVARVRRRPPSTGAPVGVATSGESLLPTGGERGGVG